ncbi:MAG: DUF4080 domain-containing protein [Gammaproteobacteria bacterium]|nr:DUF4080 domain-containing protein [Gammaproteobacteria bacterium]
MSDPIVLTTLNARYMHCAFGLRYLYANLGKLRAQAQIREFTIQQRAIDIVEQLLEPQPRIIGFSIYIWNVTQTTEVIALLKQVSPQTRVIVGGPEVSFADDLPALAELADYLVSGPGETSFRELCDDLLKDRPITSRMITGKTTALDELELPYAYYDDEDIRNRLIYVEASRGCPFRCEFCLSSLDRTARPFELARFLSAMDELYRRGARNFKFIDRSFNLKVSAGIAILEFFLERIDKDLYLHFEVVPDHLPQKLKQVLTRFPAATLQLEIGVQTFDPVIQQTISRRQNNELTRTNLHWLRENTGAHIHADLIFGLPGDTLENFARSFDQLVSLGPHEIQLGILKRLRGAPLNRHNNTYEMRYNPAAPYNLLSTRDIDFVTLQRVNRCARFWDLIGNSGRFKNLLPLILAEQPFANLLELSDYLYQLAGSTWKISLRRLFSLLYVALGGPMQRPPAQLRELLEADFRLSGEKGRPAFEDQRLDVERRTGTANKRQRQHDRAGARESSL